MKAFRFTLHRVLDWRRRQLEIEDAKFRQMTATLAELDRTRAAAEAEAIRVEVEVRHSPAILGRDLAALDGFRIAAKKRLQEIDARRVECRKNLDQQRAAMLEARRHCRLLEKLKERRHQEWQTERDREFEALAAESFLAGWSR